MDEVVGRVANYFAKAQVVVIKLEVRVKIGEVLHFRGHTTDFNQEIISMEVGHEPIESAEAGLEVAIQVDERVRRQDKVYRVAS
jgi:hypothetical protein